MTPERRAAWMHFEALRGNALTCPQTQVAFVAALEEIEHVRPVVELAKGLVDAASGEQRAVTLEALFASVAKLRAGGR